ncbi:Ribonuclease Oy [Eumeta japonica]|uniref:Ribonuclease Oy n=1 Tax=Eumeta variegata TaxID=151549 RepID=A0A4C1SBF6_EUMVA|nr:Ribonuclease Oy [Eumeta japonica]
MPIRDNGWTIHGIWPTRKGSIGPNYCNRTWTFDPKQIKSIETVLNEYWKNIEKGTPVYELWSHEWAKHGTCAADLVTLNTELKYFSQGLFWTKRFPINEFLANAGITPSPDKLYPLSDINMAIKNKINVDPIIECHKKGGTNYIAEIRICFDKNLELVDCDGVLKMGFFEDSYYSNFGDGVLSNCDRLEGLAYLPRPPPLPTVKEHLWFVQLYKLVNWLQWFTL